jgi:hypothetical protein
LHPLNDLCHCYEVNIVMVGENFIDPVKEGVEEFRVVFQPGSVEVKTERCAICVVMTFKVVVEESVELITLKVNKKLLDLVFQSEAFKVITGFYL